MAIPTPDTLCQYLLGELSASERESCETALSQGPQSHALQLELSKLEEAFANLQSSLETTSPNPNQLELDKESKEMLRQIAAGASAKPAHSKTTRPALDGSTLFWGLCASVGLLLMALLLPSYLTNSNTEQVSSQSSAGQEANSMRITLEHEQLTTSSAQELVTAPNSEPVLSPLAPAQGMNSSLPATLEVIALPEIASPSLHRGTEGQIHSDDFSEKARRGHAYEEFEEEVAQQEKAKRALLPPKESKIEEEVLASPVQPRSARD